MAAYISSQNGWWDDAATWGGAGVPGDGDTATVNHIVGIRGNVTIGTDADSNDLVVAGKLKWGDPDNELGGGATPVSGNWTLKLKCNMTIPGGGTFEVGTETYPIPEAYTATIDIGNSVINQIKTNGVIRAYGSPSYHMASADKQRTQLAADAASGTSQIQVQDAVDWVAGDILWIGTGGDKTQAPTGNEKVTILSKVNSTTYNLTAGLANDHFGGADYGDMVVYASRNVIFRGQGSSHGFMISNYWGSYTGNGVKMLFDWCRFEYAGMSGFAGVYYYWASGTRWALTQYQVSNCVFDEPGDSSAYGLGFYYTTYEPDPDFTHLNEIHFYGFSPNAQAISCGSVRGELRFGHITVMESKNEALYQSGGITLWIKSLWYTSIASPPTNNHVINGYYGLILESFKVHHAYYGFNLGGNRDYNTPRSTVIKSGEMYHIKGSTSSIGINLSTVDYGILQFDDIDFYDTEGSAIVLHMDGIAKLRNLTFNGCRNGLVLQSDLTGFSMRLSDCSFGTLAQNVYENIYAPPETSRKTNRRHVIENCVFKIPSALPVKSYDWYPEELRWGMDVTNMKNWRELADKFNAGYTIEYVNCQFLDASDVDQWPSLFPNTDILGVVAGGSQIHKTHPTNESNGYIDGTFQRKLLPFMGTYRVHITHACPIRIPVTSGQIVTVKLSLRKNITKSAAERPMIHLFGCGINDEATMSDVIDTWEELTVSGTAAVDGIVEFWVSCWGVQDFQTSVPSRGPVNNDWITYSYPIDPGGVSQSTGAKNLILYADGLSVERV